MDRGAWRTTVHGVAKSRTRLSNFTLEEWEEVGGGRRPEREGTYVYLWLIHVNVWQKATVLSSNYPPIKNNK